MHTSHSVFTDETDPATVKFTVYLGLGICLCEIQTQNQTPSQQPGTLPGGSGRLQSSATAEQTWEYWPSRASTDVICGEFCVLAPGHQGLLLLREEMALLPAAHA